MGAKSQEWVNSGLWLSFPLLFHLNKQGGWPDRAVRGGAGGGGGREGCRDWNITNEGGCAVDKLRTTWRWKACRLRCWERQTETSPHIDAAVSPQQFWEMAAICTVAAIYMNLIQPTYRFHHQPYWPAWPSCFTPPIPALLSLPLLRLSHALC